MIGTRSRIPKTTVRGDILLATLATCEEERRRTEAERRAVVKASKGQIPESEDLLFGEAVGTVSIPSPRASDAGGRGGDSVRPGGTAAYSSTAVQEPLTLGGHVLQAEKQRYDYLLDPIPSGEACVAHLRACLPAIFRMDTYNGGKSRIRRAKEARFVQLTGGIVVRPPKPLLRRILASHGVDVRELDQVVQHCLTVTAAHQYHTRQWLMHLGRWMRRVIKSDEEGKAWLRRAVVTLRRQQQRLPEKKRAKMGRRADA